MDYSNGKIYKILNTITDDAYVGSTCVGLKERFIKHKCQINCKKDFHHPLYTKMRELGTDVFYIKLLQDAPCESKAELRAIEGKYIREVGTLNTRIENRTKQQYTIDTKDRKTDYDKNYREKNNDILKQKKQEDYEKTKNDITERARKII